MKKVMQGLLVMLATFTFASNVSAKGNDTLLTYANQSHNIAGENISLSNGDIAKIERFLNSNDVTDEQANGVIAKCDQIIAILNREGVKDVTKLSKNVKNEVFNLAKEAANIVGVTLSYDKANKEIVAYKGNQRIDAISLNPYLRQTGSANTLVLVLSGAIIAASAIVVARKRFNA